MQKISFAINQVYKRQVLSFSLPLYIFILVSTIFLYHLFASTLAIKFSVPLYFSLSSNKMPCFSYLFSLSSLFSSLYLYHLRLASTLAVALRLKWHRFWIISARIIILWTRIFFHLWSENLCVKISIITRIIIIWTRIFFHLWSEYLWVKTSISTRITIPEYFSIPPYYTF